MSNPQPNGHFTFCMTPHVIMYYIGFIYSCDYLLYFCCAKNPFFFEGTMNKSQQH